MISKLRRSFENKLTSQIRNPKDVRKLFQYAKQHMSNQNPNICLVNNDGSSTTSDTETAMVFIQQFNYVYIPPVNRGSCAAPLPFIHDSVDGIDISEGLVRQKLVLLNTSKTPGPDGIHPLLLKQFADYLSGPLCIIFNLSLNTGFLPDDWKAANIVPIHKKQERKYAKNYRPISLTSVVIKMFESILKPHIINHLLNNNTN